MSSVEPMASSGAGPARRELLWVLLVLAGANLVNYGNRNALFSAYGDLRAALHLSDRELGSLGAVYMFAHALATLGFGWAGDQLDRRRVIAGGLAIASAAAALGAVAGDFELLLLSRALVGLGTAAVVPVANSILGELFEGARKASSLSIFNLGLFVGGVVGFAGGEYLGSPLVLWALSAVSAAVALAVALLPVTPRRRCLPLAVGAGTQGGWRTFVRQGRELLGAPTLRWLMLSTTSMAFAAGGYLAWFVEFLKRHRHMTEGDAMGLLALSLLGGVAGVLTGGRVADALRRRWPNGRMWTIAMGMSLTVPSALGSILLPMGASMYLAAVATMFFISWYHAPMAATVDDLATDDRAATAQGMVIFLMHFVGTAPASFLVGVASAAWGIQSAMLVPTIMVAAAAGFMLVALRTYVVDRARVLAARSSLRSSGTRATPGL
jgi:predicted MFS family arabinose efflux permease